MRPKSILKPALVGSGVKSVSTTKMTVSRAPSSLGTVQGMLQSLVSS